MVEFAKKKATLEEKHREGMEEITREWQSLAKREETLRLEMEDSMESCEKKTTIFVQEEVNQMGHVLIEEVFKVAERVESM